MSKGGGIIDIPEQFSFLGNDYTVLFEMPSGEKWGETTFRNSQIRIRPDLSRANQEATFIHELLHIIIWATGTDKHCSNEEEEDIVNRLSLGFYGLLAEGIISAPTRAKKLNV